MEKIVIIPFLLSALVLVTDLEKLSPDFIDVTIECCYVAIKVTAAVYFSLVPLVIYAYRRKHHPISTQQR